MIDGPNAAFIEVPITKGFDKSLPTIGSVKILKSALPKDPDWVLALGYKTGDGVAGKYELMELSMVSDAGYRDFLEQTDTEVGRRLHAPDLDHLLPCPFCGSAPKTEPVTALEDYEGNSLPDTVFVSCSNVNCNAFYISAYPHKWNSRADFTNEGGQNAVKKN